MTIIEVSADRLDGAVSLLGQKVIAFSRAKNWIVVHRADGDTLMRTLTASGIQGKILNRAQLEEF